MRAFRYPPAPSAAGFERSLRSDGSQQAANATTQPRHHEASLTPARDLHACRADAGDVFTFDSSGCARCRPSQSLGFNRRLVDGPGGQAPRAAGGRARPGRHASSWRWLRVSGRWTPARGHWRPPASDPACGHRPPPHRRTTVHTCGNSRSTATAGCPNGRPNATGPRPAGA